MFLIASGIRTLLGTGLAFHGSFTSQFTDGAILACVTSNLPAAAAIVPAGSPGLWAAILATTVGPNLLVTGSVATLIARRIAHDAGARLTAWQFSAVGIALVPAQLAAAALGLHITGVLR
jgi:Na+/H+ antiporter NhaD/arsenite permease-like protein